MTILTGCLYSLGVYTGLNLLIDLATGVTLRDQGDQDFHITGCLDIGLNILRVFGLNTLSDFATGVTLRDQGDQDFHITGCLDIIGLNILRVFGLNILSDFATGVTSRDQGDQDFRMIGCLYSTVLRVFGLHSAQDNGVNFLCPFFQHYPLYVKIFNVSVDATHHISRQRKFRHKKSVKFDFDVTEDPTISGQLTLRACQLS